MGICVTAFVFVPFSICTFDTYTETQTLNSFFSVSSPPETRVCVSERCFCSLSTSFGFIRCYVDIHLALLYCSVTVNVKMPFRKFDILYLDIPVLKTLYTHKLCRWIKMTTNIIIFSLLRSIHMFSIHLLNTPRIFRVHSPSCSHFHPSFRWTVFSRLHARLLCRKSKTLQYVVCTLYKKNI